MKGHHQVITGSSGSSSRYLEMFILFILCDDFSCDKVKLDMKSVLGALTVLELLYFVSLFEPALQDSSHTLDSTLCQLVSPTFVIIYPPVTSQHTV